MVLKEDEVNLGTTIIAVKYAEGVVLAADTRTSTGSYVANRVSDKLSPLHDLIYCCRSGSAADTQAISDIVKMQLESHAIQMMDKKPSVKTAAALMQRLCYEHKDQLTAGIIIAGYDDLRGPCVYGIPLGGAVIEEDFALGGSGSSYIFGWCDANYRKDMSEQEALDFVKRAVSYAIYRDGSSGGCIRTIVINREGVKRDFVEGDKVPFPVLPPVAQRV